MGVGWGVWSWPTMGTNRMGRGKCPKCAWCLGKCKVRTPHSHEGLGVGKGN
jgi:hypothetical protein